MKLKKLLLILTCCALLCCALVLASCDQEKTPSETESPTEAVTDGEQPQVEDDTITDPFYVVKDGAPIRIVYPLIYEDALYKHANTLASNIKNLTGVKPVVVDDVSAGRNGYDENSAEILIGYTAYETSKQAFAELADYSQCKIKVAGNKLVVASYDSEAINSAVTKLTLLFSKGKDGKDVVISKSHVTDFSSKGTLAEAKLPILAGKTPIMIDQADGCMELVFTSADSTLIGTYVGQLTQSGYSLYTEHQLDNNQYKTYVNATSVVNVNYVPNVAKLFVIVDSLKETALPGLASENTYTKDVTSTLLTQLGLYSNGAFNGQTDPTKSTADVNGMGYVMRLEDGSFIIIDGGHGDADDAARIFKTLRKQAPDPNSITVAAWIFTHAHGDHTGAFVAFAKSYASMVKVEKFIFNFPTDAKGTEGGGHTRSSVINTLNSTAYSKVPVVKAHFGQVFYIRNATIKILCSLEMLEPYTMSATDNSYNNTSLIFTIEAEGTKTMMLGDCYTAQNNLMRLVYTANTLKSDAVQMAHHGIDGIVSDSLYRTINAKTVFWPAGSYHYAGYVNQTTGKVHGKFANWGVTSTDMRTNPWNKWTQAADVKVYLAADDMIVAELKDGAYLVTQYDSNDAYFNS